MGRRRFTLICAFFLLLISGVLLHTAWPFLFFPRHDIPLSLTEALPSDHTSVTLAGIAENDITPPAGLPKFGYSAWAKTANGFRTRLKSRAIYLHAPGQSPLAIVQLDLGSGSLPLRHRIAERVAKHTDIPPHALTLLVTHTHSGPGQFLGSDFYNTFGSNKPGFDPVLFEFLSQRIAESVIEAYQNRREARIAIGQADIYGYTRNRSVQAWANNFSSAPSNPDPIYAVNPTMTMLRIDVRDNGTFRPAGALSLFSIHGTAIPPFTSPYHADAWHWISQTLEEQLHATSPDFIHAVAQATHADNNPNWQPELRGDNEAERIGRALGEHASRLFYSLEDKHSSKVITGIASRQLNLLDDIDIERFGLCEHAVTGASVAGAANGDEVFPLSYLPFFEEGWPRRYFTGHCQGVKQWMLSKLQLLLPKTAFPHRALFQVVRINELVLVPLPWEITLESGNRIRQAVEETLPHTNTPWRVEISSLANGYFGYAVTPEEYALQYYEGGHTLYGPHTLDFLIGQTRRLTQDWLHAGDINDIPAEQQFSLLSNTYFPVQASDTPEATTPRQWISGPTRVDATPTQRQYVSYSLLAEPVSQLALHQPLLQLRCPDRIITDNSGELQIQHIGEHDGQHDRYEVRWFFSPSQNPEPCQLEVSQPHQQGKWLAAPHKHFP